MASAVLQRPSVHWLVCHCLPLWPGLPFAMLTFVQVFERVNWGIDFTNFDKPEANSQARVQAKVQAKKGIKEFGL